MSENKHFSSWMFYDGPKDHIPPLPPPSSSSSSSSTSRSYNIEDIEILYEMFPQYSRKELINILINNNNDKNLACEWITNHLKQQNNCDNNKIETITLSPSLKIKYKRFSCGNCSTIISIPITTIESSNNYYTCPNCNITNIIPPTNTNTTEDTKKHEIKPHYSSWMFFNSPNSISSNNISTYSYKDDLNRNDINKISELFPECSLVQIEEALRVSHGDVDEACNWILAHNEYPESSGPSTTYYHPPVPVACYINDRSTPIESSITTFSCGNCHSILTVTLPTTPIHPGTQLFINCHTCGMNNIIPLRRMSHAVIF